MFRSHGATVDPSIQDGIPKGPKKGQRQAAVWDGGKRGRCEMTTFWGEVLGPFATPLLLSTHSWYERGGKL
eukprot:scaffold7735_cov248-Pinguiococcus_pyrenoidosus.AAC.5